MRLKQPSCSSQVWQGRNWIWYNIQIHFTTRNHRDTLCKRRDDREKRIFTGCRTAGLGKDLWSPSSPTPPPRQGHRAGYTGTRPGAFGMTTARETALASHAKENPILTGFTAAPALTESRAGQEAWILPGRERCGLGRGGHLALRESACQPREEPTAVPGGGHALLPPPAKGPGSAGSVTLTGWFLIFLARFFSRAPDISGGVAESSAGDDGAAAAAAPGTSHSPELTRGAASTSTRAHPRPGTAHARCSGTALKDYISQRPPRAVRGHWEEAVQEGGLRTSCSFFTGSSHGFAREEDNQHY